MNVTPQTVLRIGQFATLLYYVLAVLFVILAPSVNPNMEDFSYSREGAAMSAVYLMSTLVIYWTLFSVLNLKFKRNSYFSTSTMLLSIAVLIAYLILEKSEIIASLFQECLPHPRNMMINACAEHLGEKMRIIFLYIPIFMLSVSLLSKLISNLRQPA